MDKYEKISNRTSKRYRIYDHLPRDINSIAPITLEIHPTNKCNTACLFCAFSNLKGQEYIPHDVFSRLIDAIINLGIKSVVFSGGGEPCIYPELKTAIQKLISNNVKVGVITNGLFENDIVTALKECSWVRFSLLCSNENDFADITRTPKRNFKKICDNIKALTDFSDKNENLYVSAMFMTETGKEDVRKLYEFIELAAKLHLDQIFIKKRVENFQPDEMASDLFSDNLEHIIKYTRKHNIITNVKKFVSNEYNVYKKRNNDESCDIISMNLMGLINAKGDYYPCLYQCINSGIVYGNILSNSLANILTNRHINSLKIKEQHCSFCRHWSLRSEISKYKKSQVILGCNDPHCDFI